MSFAMDNLVIDVCASGRKAFDLAMDLVLMEHDRIEGWMVHEGTLLLYWTRTDLKDVQPLPYPMQGPQLKDFVWNWLVQAEYGHEPDHDGSNSKGWRISCGRYGTGWQVLATIKPTWAEHHK